MTYKPMTREEIQNYEKEMNKPKLLPGEHYYEVINADKKTSKNGNLMLEVKFQAADGNGKTGIVRDWFVYNEKDFNKYKQYAFCRSAGKQDFYFDNRLNEYSVLGFRGKFKLIIEKKEDGKEFLKVDKYLKPDGLMNQEQKEQGDNTIDDDDIPF